MNTIYRIHPYKSEGTWVFDDEDRGLVQEPFVAGADTLIDAMTAHIPNAASGVAIDFSDQQYPGFQHQFFRNKPESGGWWYYSYEFVKYGWLCPALFKFFLEAPRRLYVSVKALES